MKKSHLAVFAITMLTMLTLVMTRTSSVRKSMKLGLDLQDGLEILYEMNPLGSKKLPPMTAATKSVEECADALNVNESEIAVRGDNCIRIQFADVKNVDQARGVISPTANLTFYDMNDSPLINFIVLQEDGASVMYDNYNRPIVSLRLSSQGKSCEVTRKVSQMGSDSNLMVTWPDFNPGTDSYAEKKDQRNPKFIPATTVSGGTNSTNTQISGSSTREEVTGLKDLISSDPLPAGTNEKYSNAVTADYGINVFSETILAGGIGIALIILFMILYYRLPSLISATTSVTYVSIVFLIYNTTDVIFTLSGITTLILGVGMVTDSNILTFERIEDVLYSGRSVKTAFYEGGSKSFIMIFDAQVIIFICALILYMMGTGSAESLTTMLIASMISTIILIVLVIKFLLSLLVNSGQLNDKLSWSGVKKAHVPDMNRGQGRFYFGLFKSFDLVKNARYFIIVSVTMFVIGMGCTIFQGVKGNGILNWGINSTSGTKLTVQSDTAVSRDKLNDQLESLGTSANSVKISGEKDNIANIFVKDAIDEHKVDTAKARLKGTYQYNVSDNVVIPVIGQELVRSATLISTLAWIGVLVYISIRFKWDYVIGGIVGLIRDVFFVLVACTIFRLGVNAEIIAVPLTVIGYLINNSTVTFGRIRDKVKERKLATTTKIEYRKIVNKALQRMATRSTLSILTAILPVVCLLFFEGSVIRIFYLALLIDVVYGAGSPLLVAAQLRYQIRIHQDLKKHVRKRYRRRKDELEEMTVPGMSDY